MSGYSFVTEAGFFFSSSTTVGGGSDNWATADGATIGGGRANTCEESFGTVVGGVGNRCVGSHGFIAGGLDNLIDLAPTSAIGGGFRNEIRGAISDCTISGGSGNLIEGPPPSASGGTVGGLPFLGSTIGGGAGNGISLAQGATIAGGAANTASGNYAAIPGGRQNLALGEYSFAAGRRAQANHDGSFVWADSQDVDYGTTTPNEFRVRASGGYQFDGPGVLNGTLRVNASTRIAGDLLVIGAVTAPVFIGLSDRNAKTNFAAVDGRDILNRLASIPVQRWNYKEDLSTRHIGPMAQDFYAAFDVGPDNKHIATVDADGVAFAAIQGLHELVKEKDAQMKAQRTELDNLKERVGALEKLLTRLTAEK